MIIYIYVCMCVVWYIYIEIVYVCIIIPLMLIWLNMFISTFTPEKTGPFQEFRALFPISSRDPWLGYAAAWCFGGRKVSSLRALGVLNFLQSRPWRWEEVVDQEVHRHGYMICMKYYEMYIYIYSIYWNIMKLWNSEIKARQLDITYSEGGNSVGKSSNSRIFQHAVGMKLLLLLLLDPFPHL